MPYRGPYCSEVVYVPGTHPPPEDCVAAAGIDIANCATGGAISVSAVEREALRVACGDTVGGMDLAHLRIGLNKRYNLLGTYFGTLDAIRKALAGGWALVILGWLDAVPKVYWQQNTGTVFHAMAFNQGDKPGWCHLSNPLSPKGHKGWEVSIDTALEFARSSNGRGGIPRGVYALGLPERPQSGPVTVLPVISDRTPLLVDLKVGDQLLDVNGKPLTLVAVAQTQYSPWQEELSPTAHYRLIGVTTGGKDTPCLVHETPMNTHPIPSTGDKTHTVTLSVDGIQAFTTKV